MAGAREAAKAASAAAICAGMALACAQRVGLPVFPPYGLGTGRRPWRRGGRRPRSMQSALPRERCPSGPTYGDKLDLSHWAHCFGFGIVSYALAMAGLLLAVRLSTARQRMLIASQIKRTGPAMASYAMATGPALGGRPSTARQTDQCWLVNVNKRGLEAGLYWSWLGALLAVS